MTDVLPTVALGIGGALFIVIGVPILLRLRRQWPPIHVHILLGVIAETLVISVGIIFVDGFHFWLATSLTGLAAVANLFAFSAVYKSISLRMLLYLAREPSRSAPFEALVEDVVEPIIESRLSLLQSMELVARTGDGAFQPTESGRKYAERFHKVQRLFGIARSGLYSSGEE